MPKAKARPVKGSQAPTFDVEAFLESVGAARRLVVFPKGKVVFAQGEPSDAVMYIQKGGVRISVLSRSGKEAVVAMLGPGDFFGEGALTGQPVRIGTATATTHVTVFVIEKGAMLRLLHEEPAFSDAFISFMLSRNIRIEADLVDQLFNSSEKRLARALLLLAQYTGQTGAERTIPRISQETLADMIGTTRSRVNFFMNKFRELGFIEYNGGLKINSALLSVVLHD
ncbi:MAG TPA: Crp/Fnr family transcriptional regulator [Vicinamibacterales bacterium]|nr:Crp/Fnr family transcriptional regulator [Vicinamibacterales bacterium]